MPILTLVTVRGIHDYAYHGVSRLRQTVGASSIIQAAMESLGGVPGFHHEGGGHGVLLSESPAEAAAGIEVWSRRQREDSPGLRFAVVHFPYERGHLGMVFDQALGKLEQESNRPHFGSPLGILPIQRRCAFIDRPAEFCENEVYLSREAQAKEAAGAKPDYRGYVLPVDLDQLGTKTGEAHLGVIHPDGNEIGFLVREAVRALREMPDDGFLEGLKQVGTWIDNSTKAANRKLLKQLHDTLPALEAAGILSRPDDAEKNWLPCRWLIEAGDEASLVIHGRVAVSAAAQWLRLLEKESIARRPDLAGLPPRLTASAGVLIIPPKFPFSRAFALAQELARNAKEKRKENNSVDSFLDFEILREGSSGSIKALRSMQSIFPRTYRVTGEDPEWEQFEIRWQELRCKWPRSAAKSFLEALGDGTYEIFLRDQAGRIRIPRHGSARDYFDPLDAYDLHVGIDWESGQVILPESQSR